jgi:small conductance mechanosensitive channel
VIALVILGWAFAMNLGRAIGPTLLKRLEPGTAGGVAGTVEGTVSSLGLPYTTLSHRADRIMVPNNVVLSAAVVPVREPDGVDLRAKVDAGVRPSDVDRLLREAVTVRTRMDPDVELEELDEGQLVYRVRATPADSADGPELADEVVAALAQVSNGRDDG